MALIGIDLGTTNSLVAVWKDDKVELLKNSLGNVLIPSVVSLNDDGRNILVGETARQRRVSHPGLTVAEFKRTMVTPKQYKLGNAQYTSVDLSAFLLKKLVADASEQFELRMAAVMRLNPCTRCASVNSCVRYMTHTICNHY